MAKERPRSTYVAFLRGVNVGGHRVKMDDLRDLFTALGYANVATFIASGNVIFEAADDDVTSHESRIEDHLEASLGYSVPTHIRTPGELAAIAAFRPFEDHDAAGHTLHVGFLRRVPDAEAERATLAFRGKMDDFRIHGRELYWLCRGKTTDSEASWPRIAKALGVSSTMRNVTTIRKLAALYPSV